MNLSLRLPTALRSDRGSSLFEMALLTPFLLLLLLGVVDFGRAYYLSSEVAGAAHAGALYATENPFDNAGIDNAAIGDAPNVPGLTANNINVSEGCECSDGTGFSANCSSTPTTCSANVVSKISVTVSAVYTTLFPWPGVPRSISLTQTATMRTGAGA
jgi:Flp pilus assembly protein TadG